MRALSPHRFHPASLLLVFGQRKLSPEPFSDDAFQVRPVGTRNFVLPWLNRLVLFVSCETPHLFPVPLSICVKTKSGRVIFYVIILINNSLSQHIPKWTEGQKSKKSLTFLVPSSDVSAERFCCHAESAQRDNDDLCSRGGIFSRPCGRDPVSSTGPQE